jgi:transcriptional regulator of arginine metabolism
MPTAPAIRDKRQQAILKILAARPVARQSEFVSLLVKDGYEATQSSVSRDLRELGITKLEQGYARSEPAGNSAANVAIPTDFVRDVLTAGTSLTVVKTATGAAQRVALFLDRSNWPEIVGTVSGDDTIFVATRNGKEQKQLLSRIRASLQT